MRIILMVVWLGSGGEITSDPWRYLPDMAACRGAIDEAEHDHGSHRFVMLGACVSEDRVSSGTAYDLTIEPASPQ